MKNAVLIATSSMLAGCATLQGQPTPVVDMDSLATVVREIYAPATVIRTYNGEFCTGTPPVSDGFIEYTEKTNSWYGRNDEVTRQVKGRCITGTQPKKAYRDEVLFTYLAAADARYVNFKASITSQRKYGNALMSVVGLYTSALASVASGGLATGFAASSTFVQGSQGSLNKDLFYEQTLPALINIMEAERTSVRNEINLRILRDRATSDAITYTLAEVLTDIGRYENAASIEKAVATLTQRAAQELTTAENEAKSVKKLRDDLEAEGAIRKRDQPQPQPEPTGQP
ncbi:hypothetical protein [Pseudoblastomonas halimionae]|uniref:Uncharacterized protein n=1 Tax=Alteriqipengyuania halimionae TaxID=1926630 RepID=A0A6I4U2C8_9SPHN|nr:hypothetical protein [Alteriqipengyuania halimionae]MXP10229.1 hypothetical protein [Alteriqipengyuania halimionae]